MSAQSRQVAGSHYQGEVQPWDAMESWMYPAEFQAYLRGNAIKYLARCTKKGTYRQDIEKAHHYLEKLLEVIE